MLILGGLAPQLQHAEARGGVLPAKATVCWAGKNLAASFGLVFGWRLLNPERHAGNIGVRLDLLYGHVELDDRAATTNALLGVFY